MDDITKLILAKYQVENIIELIKDNPYRQYMFMHLNPVFYELDLQVFQDQLLPYTDSLTQHPYAYSLQVTIPSL